MIKGINKKEENIIKNILKDYQKDFTFYYYGSRVKGTHEKTSDLDILIKGKDKIPLAALEELKEKFDSSLLPFVVNFSDYNSITKEFYNLIQKDLVIV